MNKRQSQINKINQKIEARLKQKNTDKRWRDIEKLNKRLDNLKNNRPLGKKERIKKEIQNISQRSFNPLISDGGRDYLNRKKEELKESLKRIQTEQKRSQRLKKLLSKGLLPGQIKRGKKPILSTEEAKRRRGYRSYINRLHSRRETYLKGLFKDIFGKEEGKKKFSITLKRRENYKGKSGWFSKWVKKTERNLFRGEKSLEKSNKKKELKTLSEITGMKVEKRKKKQGWNNWFNKELERLTKARDKEKEKWLKDWGVDYDEKEIKKKDAEIWDVNSSYTKGSKGGDKKWYDDKDLFIVTSRASTLIGVWKDGWEYVIDFNKNIISGLVIDFDGDNLWSERRW